MRTKPNKTYLILSSLITHHLSLLAPLSSLLFPLKFQNHCLTRAQLDVLLQTDRTPRGDVGCLGLVLYEFGISGNLQRGRLAGAVQNGYHIVAMPAAGHHLDTVIGNELLLHAADNGLVAVAPVQDV